MDPAVKLLAVVALLLCCADARQLQQGAQCPAAIVQAYTATINSPEFKAGNVTLKSGALPCCSCIPSEL